MDSSGARSEVLDGTNSEETSMMFFIRSIAACAPACVLLSLSIMAGPAFASQIQVGGVNGLTGAYITAGCSTNVVGQTCIAGSTGGFTEQNYDSSLFAGATNSGVPPTPYIGYNSNAAAAGTLTDTSNAGGNGNVTYSMINDGVTSGKSNNFWGATRAGTITVPIGVYDVFEAGIMLDNIFGTAGSNDTTIEFDFGNNAHSVSSMLILNLVNATAGSTPASGQVGTSVDCTTTGQPCFTYAIGPLASASVVNGITVTTNTLFSTSYNTGATGVYANSSGSLRLDDLVFLFGNTYANQYLVDIKVTENNGASGTSQTALSAITVDSGATTPEPSTVLLALAGFGALGAARWRRNARLRST
jgi:hypothetical protein